MASYQESDSGYPAVGGAQAYAPAPDTSSVPASNPIVSGSAFKSSGVREPKVLIRGVAAFCALVAFSCVAAANNRVTSVGVDLNSASEEFLIFVGVVSIFLDAAFIVTYLRGERLPPTWLARLPLTELIVSAIWAILWFAASIAVAADIVGISDPLNVIPVSTFNAGIAFGFFACFLWAASTFFAFRVYRSGSGASGPMQYNDI